MEVFRNGEVIILTNNDDFSAFYKNNLYAFSGELCDLINETPVDVDRFFIWPANAKEPLPKMLDDLSICHGITLYEKDDYSVKSIAFATERNNSKIHNFYINHLDILKKIRDQFFFQYKNELAKHFLLDPIKTTNIIKFENSTSQGQAPP